MPLEANRFEGAHLLILKDIIVYGYKVIDEPFLQWEAFTFNGLNFDKAGKLAEQKVNI